jgi:hypothetical protein
MSKTFPLLVRDKDDVFDGDVFVADQIFVGNFGAGAKIQKNFLQLQGKIVLY